MAGWRRDVADTLRRDVTAGQLRLLFALNPPRGYFPDFLTPLDSSRRARAGPRRDPVDPDRPPASRPDRPGRRQRAAVDRVRASPGATARPWPTSPTRCAPTARWRSGRTGPGSRRRWRPTAAGGPGRCSTAAPAGCSTSLRPAMRWNAGVLEVAHYPVSRELHLDGRGLLLVPSYFCARTPVTLLDPALPPVLVYPVDRLGGAHGPTTTWCRTPTGGRTGRPCRAARAAPGPRCWRRSTRAARPARSPAGWTSPRRRPASTRRCCATPACWSAGASATRVLHTLTPLGRAMLDA